MTTQSQLNQLQHSFSDINELIANAVVEQLVAGGGTNIKQNFAPDNTDGDGKKTSYFCYLFVFFYKKKVSVRK